MFFLSTPLVDSADRRVLSFSYTEKIVSSGIVNDSIDIASANNFSSRR